MDDHRGEGRILTGREIAQDVEERPDVCVVGSGAGGAVVAARLAERGLRVVVLEEGGYYRPSDADMQEGTAYPRLYQDHGQRATADLAITILQGRTVGGSTAVNWTTSFRTPERVLAHWRAVHGLDAFTTEALAPHFAAVEARLNIHEQPDEGVNANNRTLWDGAGKLGWARARTRRNVDGCANLGYCGMGCPIGARTSMDITYLPDAVAHGARLYANTRAVRLEKTGRRVSAVHGEVLDSATDRPTGRRVLVRPRLVVLSGGAINTPALLLRSDIRLAGKVGARTFLHPVAGVLGLYPRPIEGFYGAPQSVASHEFVERGPGKIGFFLEAAPVHPVLAATALGGFGALHESFMARLSHASALIALTVDGFLPDEEGGTVSLRSDGRLRIDYPLRAEMWEALREGSKALARVHLAAGATAAYSLHEEPVEMRVESDVDKLDRAPWQPCRLQLFTAHQMGGCAMGQDPERSCTSAEFRLHAHENVFVVDGSVLPTSLGVNPQLTIFGLAHLAAEHVAAAVR
ncbi:MAG TPA: GMC family oxidoreductase [Anaeromyxobacteraceae bacterium]|nr:GMC family oxidoreductase [Anaeromyxobacteraceae bacterium]